MTYLDEILAAALELARAARWQRGLSLLDAAAADAADATDDADGGDATDGGDTADGLGARDDRRRIALAAAEVALESDWFAGTALAADRLDAAVRLGGTSWKLEFLRLRHDYFGQLLGSGSFRFGPAGKDPLVLAGLRERATGLAERAADEIDRGWGRMYLGLIADNLFAEREAAPAHYEEALRAGEKGDDLLAREALRHLGDHDRDNGDLGAARDRWERATALGAGAGLVCGTLSQQMFLAVLARDTGDEAGAVRLAEEIARWAGAVGAHRLHDQASAFLAGQRIA